MREKGILLPLTAMPDPVVTFYSGGRDSQGRTLAEILAWNDGALEAVHDYIQWLFPTRLPSGVNADAPLVAPSTVEAFAGNPALREELRHAFTRMLAFYGLTRVGERIEMDADRFDDRARVWLRPGNHNHLRLTRIMDSLTTLGLEQEAGALRRCLLDDVAAGPGAGRISPRTLQFWAE